MEATAVIRPKEGRDGSPFEEKGYEKDLETALVAEIKTKAASAAKKEQHHKKGPNFSLGEMANVANAAKGQVDQVFGSWAVGGQFSAGGNLKDRYVEERAEQSRMKPDEKKHAARHRAEYLVNNQLQTVDQDHHADRSVDPAKSIANAVIDRVANAHVDELLTITATWSANTEADGTVRIQVQKTGDDDADRDTLWDKFGTLCHEYIHSLANPKWREHRETLKGKDSQGKNTLAEGVTELLTRIVVSQIKTSDPALRKQVLGKVSDDGEEVVIDRNSSYADAYARALELSGVIGMHNLYAAYFLGRVDLLAV